ncbi:hypothetical protein PAXRUDRAFT_821203 [Paxillus rubicundulus Ve08.2h10]|uniref:Uncharacterized protein n=1 Tax=Paxillus rubicundulus Ve08.2h10 TaxID=930991 RepID=A0A0D0DYK7_9AGAM|nr:hypothetical protein PAXRUDRAFT_821203 [Paxillus rubicundulus Ve08.2h10]
MEVYIAGKSLHLRLELTKALATSPEVREDHPGKGMVCSVWEDVEPSQTAGQPKDRALDGLKNC